MASPYSFADLAALLPASPESDAAGCVANANALLAYLGVTEPLGSAFGGLLVYLTVLHVATVGALCWRARQGGWRAGWRVKQ